MRCLPGAVLLALTFTPAAPGLAQVPDRDSAVGTALSDYGGFVGLDLTFGDLIDDSAIFVGGHAAVMLKSRLFLGLAGAGLANNDAAIEMGYGGLLVGYVLPLAPLVHVTAETVLAGGGIKHRDDAEAGNEDWNSTLVVEPRLTVEFRLARIARLGFGVGYRYVGGFGMENIRDQDMRGMTGTAALRIGWF